MQKPIAVDPLKGRFKQSFPISAWFIGNVWLLLPVFLFVALLLSTLSIHYALSVMCVWLAVLCFWVDRRHLEFCLFTPLQPLAVVLLMSLGLGVSMVVIDSDEKYVKGLFWMQMLGLLTFPLFMLGYALMMKRVPAFVFPQRTTNATFTRSLVYVGWICLIYELGKVVVGVVTGTMDRGYGGDFILEQRFGWWSAFGVFPRIQTLGFLMAPLIWRESRGPGKPAVAVTVGIILFIHFVAASRGSVVFPLFILIAGCYMCWAGKRLKYERLVLLGVVAIAPFLTFMAHYRSTEAFREVPLKNLFLKLATMKEGLARKREMEAQFGDRFAESGRSLIGVADFLVYEMTPDSVPHEGSGRLENLIWVFVPAMFSSGPRPNLWDGYEIVGTYTGVMLERTAIGITFPADLYRRWGWTAVPFGLLIYGVFYGAIFRYVYTLYMKRNALLGFLVCGLLFNFFIAWFWTTILSMSWLWLYDMPKHLALIGAIYLVVSHGRTPGAEMLAGIVRLPVRRGFRHAPLPSMALPNRPAPQNRQNS
jgi:hypothetical protein